MIRKMTLAVGSLVMMLGVGCTSDIEDTDASEDSLNAQSTALWPVVNGVAKVPVCWLPAKRSDAKQFPVKALGRPSDRDLAERKAWVKSIVESQWNARTALEFVGWKACGSDKSKMVQLVPMDSSVEEGNYDPGQPHTQALGKHLRGKKAFLNVFFGDESIYRSRLAADAKARGVKVDPSDNPEQNWLPSACFDQLKRVRTDIGDPKVLAETMAIYESCLKNNVLHEFGHIAGFAHEQFRSDVSKACQKELGITKSDMQNIPKDSQGATPLGPFDAESIMSYCRKDPAPTLTAEDIAMANRAYGRSAGTRGRDGKDGEDGRDG